MELYVGSKGNHILGLKVRMVMRVIGMTEQCCKVKEDISWTWHPLLLWQWDKSCLSRIALLARGNQFFYRPHPLFLA